MMLMGEFMGDKADGGWLLGGATTVLMRPATTPNSIHTEKEG